MNVNPPSPDPGANNPVWGEVRDTVRTNTGIIHGHHLVSLTLFPLLLEDMTPSGSSKKLDIPTLTSSSSVTKLFNLA